MNDTHQALFEATGRLLRERGFAGASIRAIAKEAGMLPGSVTYRYPTKEALVIAMMQHGMAIATTSLRAHLEEEGLTPLQRIRKIMRTMMGFVVSDSQAVWLLRHEWNRLPVAIRDALDRDTCAFEALARSSFEEAARDGMLLPGLDVELVLRVFESVTSGVAAWYTPESGRTLDEVADVFTTVLSFGVLSPEFRTLADPNPGRAQIREEKDEVIHEC